MIEGFQEKETIPCGAGLNFATTLFSLHATDDLRSTYQDAPIATRSRLSGAVPRHQLR